MEKAAALGPSSSDCRNTSTFTLIDRHLTKLTKGDTRKRTNEQGLI